MTRALAIILTILTGFTGLVYEVAWQKSLATLLGSHGEATAAVLAIFLGGLSLGYALFGRITARRMEIARSTHGKPRLLLLYGAVEASIGLWALAFPTLFETAQAISVWLPFRHDPGAFISDILLAALLIGPPTVMMGGTIPLLTQALSRSMADATRFHALVYGFNTAGAFAGALAAGFILVPSFGIPGTLFAMGAINLLVGAIFAVLGLLNLEVPPEPSAASDVDRKIEGFAVYAAAALLMGFAMMSVQTVLIRVGGLALGASHFTFAMVVAVFVFCIAVGSLAVSVASRIPRVAVVLAPAFVAVSLTALYLVVDLVPWASHLLRSLFRDIGFAFYPFYAATFLCILAALAIPAGLSGASLPLLFHELRRVHGDLGGVAGRLYSWNTIGNLMGALLGGYILFFWLDLHHVYRIGVASAGLAAGLLALRLYSSRRNAIALSLVALIMGLAMLPGWSQERLSSGLFRERSLQPHSLEGPDQPFQRSEIVFYTDDPTATITVKDFGVDSSSPSLSIFTNAKSDGAVIGDIQTMSLIGLLPCLAAETCKDAFVIGYGTGTTVGVLAELESNERVVVAEISRGVIEAAPLFDPFNRNTSKNPKVEILQSDAYRALLRSETRYDVIASEPSNPWMAGVEMLFSQEFLEAAKSRLTSGGVYVQWIHTYESDTASLELVLRTYASVFDRLAVWYGLGPDLLLLGLMPDAKLDLERFEERMQQRDFKAVLRRTGIDTLPKLLAHEVLPLGLVHEAGLEGDIHTLLHPRLSDRAARAFFLGGDARLPQPVGTRAVATGARESLLAAWLAQDAPVSETARKEWIDVVCGNRIELCATALAHWTHEDPESKILAKVRRRMEGNVSSETVDLLATFYASGPSGSLNSNGARRLSETYLEHFYYAIPFEREAFRQIWRKCRGSNCALAKRDFRDALGP
jgi:predicted membrane-bound spermidine synthase